MDPQQNQPNNVQNYSPLPPYLTSTVTSPQLTTPPTTPRKSSGGKWVLVAAFLLLTSGVVGGGALYVSRTSKASVAPTPILQIQRILTPTLAPSVPPTPTVSEDEQATDAAEIIIDDPASDLNEVKTDINNL